MDVDLWFDMTLLGHVSDVVEEDGTFSGTVTLALDDSATASELRRYVEFCEDWNERTRTNAHPPSASEFGARFARAVQSNAWSMRTGDVRAVIEDAPTFFRGNEVSWRIRRP
jgi:hypothetical protein